MAKDELGNQLSNLYVDTDLSKVNTDDLFALALIMYVVVSDKAKLESQLGVKFADDIKSYADDEFGVIKDKADIDEANQIIKNIDTQIKKVSNTAGYDSFDNVVPKLITKLKSEGDIAQLKKTAYLFKKYASSLNSYRDARRRRIGENIAIGVMVVAVIGLAYILITKKKITIPAIA